MARHPYLGAGSQGIPKSEDRTVIEKKPPANHVHHHHHPPSGREKLEEI